MIRKFTCFTIAALALSGPTASVAQTDIDSAISKIKSSNTLRVCEAAYPPYNVKNPKENVWEGMNVDIAELIANHLGVDLQHVDSSFSTLIPSLNSGKCDLSVAATYVSPERAEQILFTDSFSSDTKTIFVPEDSDINSYTDIDRKGKTIVSRAGTSELKFAQSYFEHATVKPITSSATQAHLLEVAAGRADGAFAGTAGGILFIQDNPNVKLRKIDDKPLSPSLFAFMLPAGQYHFQQYINIILRDLEQEGTMEKLKNKWLGTSE